MRSIGDSGTLGEFAALLKFTAAISQMIALRIVLAWVIAPPFFIEKAGLIMTLKRSKNQLSLLRIAPTSKRIHPIAIIETYWYKYARRRRGQSEERQRNR
jgi:hypothetical protein